MSNARWLQIAPLLLLAQLGACNCPDEELNKLHSTIQVTPSPVEFGFRRVGADTALVVKLANVGTASLSVENILVDPPEAPYKVLPLPEGGSLEVIAEGSFTSFQLVFTPPARGDFPAKLIFKNNDPDNATYEVDILGSGGPPRLRVLPETVSFDLVSQGTPAMRDVVLTNIGLDDLHVTEVKLDPSSNPGFRLAPENNFGSGTIPVEQSARVTILMDPTVTGSATGTLHVLSDAAGSPDTLVPITAIANLAPVVPLVEKVSRLADVQSDLYVEVIVDASGTMDPDGDAFTIKAPGAPGNTWRVLERPEGSVAILEALPEPTQAKLFIDTVGIYKVQLTVADTRGAIGTGIATIRAIRDLALQLTWEPAPNAPCLVDSSCGRTDLDLHLIAPTGMVGDYFAGCSNTAGCDASCGFQPSCNPSTQTCPSCVSTGLDCSYANRRPDWGVLGNHSDDPSQDIDDVYGAGPENISLNGPVAGNYLVEVHFCNDRLTTEGAIAKVKVLFHGVEAGTLGPVNLQAEGNLWTAGVVTYRPGMNPDFVLMPVGSNQTPAITAAAPDLCNR